MEVSRMSAPQATSPSPRLQEEATGAYRVSTGSAVPIEPVKPRAMADPTPIAFGMFGFALLIYGVRFVNVAPTTLTGASTYAATYGVLIAGLAQTLVAGFAIVRGMSYPGWILGLFGMWLIGLFLLLTHIDTSPLAKVPAGDARAKAAANATIAAWHANSVGWYVLALLIPLVLMAVPAFVHRNVPFFIAFAGLIGLIALLGLAFHSIYAIVTDATKGGSGDLSTPVDLLKASAYFAFASAATIWFVMAKEVYVMTGVLKPRSNAARA
jgi:hypothetical protein